MLWLIKSSKRGLVKNLLGKLFLTCEVMHFRCIAKHDSGWGGKGRPVVIVSLICLSAARNANIIQTSVRICLV